MAKKRSFDGNVGELVSEYNSIRENKDLKINKHDAVKAIAKNYNYTQKEVYRILNEEKEKGEFYVYSRNIDENTAEGIYNMRRDLGFERGSGALIADMLGVSKSSVYRHSKQVSNLANQERKYEEAIFTPISEEKVNMLEGNNYKEAKIAPLEEKVKGKWFTKAIAASFLIALPFLSINCGDNGNSAKANKKEKKVAEIVDKGKLTSLNNRLDKLEGQLSDLCSRSDEINEHIKGWVLGDNNKLVPNLYLQSEQLAQLIKTESELPIVTDVQPALPVVIQPEAIPVSKEKNTSNLEEKVETQSSIYLSPEQTANKIAIDFAREIRMDGAGSSTAQTYLDKIKEIDKNIGISPENKEYMKDSLYMKWINEAKMEIEEEKKDLELVLGGSLN